MSQSQRSASTGPSARPVLTHRYSTPHANSSAYSASAHAGEDWTQISDLSERRRIQNRIAQRNYRKKLKKRLENLERRASASPEPETRSGSHEGEQSSRTPSSRATPASAARYSPERYSQSPETSYPHSPVQPSYLALPDDRHLSHTQPTLSYSSYSGFDDFAARYPHSPALSSTYTVPSPALSAVSHEDNSYLTMMARHPSYLPLPQILGSTRSEHTDQENHTYNYGYGVADDKQRHWSAPSAFAAYPDPNYTYTMYPIDAFHHYDSSFSEWSPDMWSLLPDAMMEEPIYFSL